MGDGGEGVGPGHRWEIQPSVRAEDQRRRGWKRRGGDDNSVKWMGGRVTDQRQRGRGSVGDGGGGTGCAGRTRDGREGADLGGHGKEAADPIGHNGEGAVPAVDGGKRWDGGGGMEFESSLWLGRAGGNMFLYLGV
jgi:hypothetical protein